MTVLRRTGVLLWLGALFLGSTSVLASNLAERQAKETANLNRRFNQKVGAIADKQLVEMKRATRLRGKAKIDARRKVFNMQKSMHQADRNHRKALKNLRDRQAAQRKVERRRRVTNLIARLGLNLDRTDTAGGDEPDSAGDSGVVNAPAPRNSPTAKTTSEDLVFPGSKSK